MSRHVLDRPGPAQSSRAVKRFLDIGRTDAGGGINRLIARMDRVQKTRTGSRLPAFLKIARGWRA